MPGPRPRKLRKDAHLQRESNRLTIDSVEDFDKAKHLVQSAAKSGAYLYPIKVKFLISYLRLLINFFRESTSS
jgi:spore coat polysaccharide biosynthesis protein SpsF (cytidylyltransferase family)